MGLVPSHRRHASRFEGTDLTRAPSHRARPARHRLRAAGPRDLPAPHRGGEPAHGARPRSRRQRAVPERIFEMFPVLKQMLRRRGGDLSGGQQQQLAIGRALAHASPKLLILDEPTEGIQPSIIKDIERAIRALAAARRDGDPAGRAVLRLRPFAGRPLPGDGARRDRRARQGRDMDRDGVRAICRCEPRHRMRGAHSMSSAQANASQISLSPVAKSSVYEIA